MNISELPKEKNITEFTDAELFLWLKNYVEGWAKGGVGPSVHYEAVKTELARRGNERILSLTERLHKLTVVLVWLTGILVILTLILIFRG